MNYESTFAFLLNLSVQAALLIVGAYVVILIFRIRDSIIRYGIWLSVLLGCGALLLFSAIKPPPNVLPLFGSAFRVETGGIGRMEGRPEADFRMDSETSNETPKSQSKGDSEVPPFGKGGLGGITEHKRSLRFDFQLILILLWLSGASWQLVRFARGSYLLLRLFRKSSQVSDARMKALVEEIAGEIGLRNRVSLRSSSEIDGPVSLGFFKPVVILPRTLAEKLSEEELRMVLIHELAHIKRLDFVVNLIQSLLGIVLYFHPAFYLLKSRLARERESICDDWVVYMTGKRSAYARCLMDIKENGACSAFGTGIFRVRENLGRRIKMILDEKRRLKIQMPRGMLAILALLACISIPLIATVQPVSSSPEPESASPSNVSDEELVGRTVITDPETAVKYTRTKTLVGKSDVIDIDYAGLSLSLSPNGKFLLWRKLVVPLDGGEPFDLVDMVTLNSSWSPDGKKVAFYSSGAIWVIPVSPETGQSTGPAKKLLDGGYYGLWVCGNPSWSPDSERIVFEWRDKERQGDIWTLSVEDGALTQITDDSGRDPIWSPDGKTIAYRMDREEERETWLVPAEGGTPKKISTGKFKAGEGHPSWCNWYWSPDSQWLVGYTLSWERLWFLRFADGREFDVTRKKEVGYHFGWSPGGEKMLFYRSSYAPKSALKVVSVAGGPSFELGSRLTLWPWKQSWSPDSRMIVADGENKDGAEGWYGLWVIPVAGGDPFLLELDVSIPGELAPYWYPSPDCGKLFFSVKRSDNGKDLWVVPISLKDGRTTGPAVMVFGAWEGRTAIPWEWSPDGTKLAVIHKGDIWVASADGGEPVQITKTPEDEIGPKWSPDGKMIAYSGGALMVVPASGGEATKILDITGRSVEYAWSPDSKELGVLSSNRLYRKEGVILTISIPDGKTRQILDLGEQPVDDARNLRWSPDGRNLALTGSNYLTIVDSKPRNQILIVPAEGGRVTGIAADYSGGMGNNYGPISWSPDGNWISYSSDAFVKTRPEGEIWEADVSELLSGAEKEQ